MNDIDELLRDFRSTLDEPPRGALARARSRALANRAARARSRPRWLAIPATAIGVTAVAVTASLLFGQSSPPGTTPTVQPGSAVTTTEATTAELIEAWARDLEAGPPAPPAVPGQLILPSSRRFADGQWTDEPPGHITVERDGLLIIDNAEHSSRESFQQYVAQQRAEFAQQGASWRYPTAEWLEALDPSPASLLAAIQSTACGGECTEWQVWNEIESMMARGEVVLPPRIRAGLLRLLGTFDGVTAYEDTVDGRRVRVVSLPDTVEVRPGLTLSYSRAELYIDPDLNRFVGSGILETGRSPDLPQCVNTGIGATPLPRPTGDECLEVVPVDPPVRVAIRLWEQTLETPAGS
jgi:hypothetical protein